MIMTMMVVMVVMMTTRITMMLTMVIQFPGVPWATTASVVRRRSAGTAAKTVAAASAQTSVCARGATVDAHAPNRAATAPA